MARKQLLGVGGVRTPRRIGRAPPYRSPVSLILSGELCYRYADARDNSAFLLEEENSHGSVACTPARSVRVKGSLKVTEINPVRSANGCCKFPV